MSRWRLDGQRALVTGGTRGIGAAITAELRALGASVLTLARSGADLCVDLSEPGAAAELIGKLDGLEILVNNVGTNVRKPTVGYAPSDYQRVLDTNLTAAFQLCQAAQPLLARSGGSIVNIGSVASTVGIGTGAALLRA